MLGYDNASNTISKKIGFLSIMLGGMLMYWFWSAMLNSYFFIPSKELPFNDLKGFLTQSNQKVVLKLKSDHELL